MLFGSYWTKEKLAYLSLYEKGERVQLPFWSQYYFQWSYKAIRNNIVAKKITEHVLLFHKKRQEN